MLWWSAFHSNTANLLLLTSSLPNCPGIMRFVNHHLVQVCITLQMQGSIAYCRSLFQRISCFCLWQNCCRPFFAWIHWWLFGHYRAGIFFASCFLVSQKSRIWDLSHMFIVWTFKSCNGKSIGSCFHSGQHFVAIWQNPHHGHVIGARILRSNLCGPCIFRGNANHIIIFFTFFLTTFHHTQHVIVETCHIFCWGDLGDGFRRGWHGRLWRNCRNTVLSLHNRSFRCCVTRQGRRHHRLWRQIIGIHCQNDSVDCMWCFFSCSGTFSLYHNMLTCSQKPFTKKLAFSRCHSRESSLCTLL